MSWSVLGKLASSSTHGGNDSWSVIDFSNWQLASSLSFEWKAHLDFITLNWDPRKWGRMLMVESGKWTHFLLVFFWQILALWGQQRHFHCMWQWTPFHRKMKRKPESNRCSLQLPLAHSKWAGLQLMSKAPRKGEVKQKPLSGLAQAVSVAFVFSFRMCVPSALDIFPKCLMSLGL